MQLEGLQIGRYHLIRLIGSGGVGQVYLAKDTQLLIGREVAVKVITPPDDQEEARIVIDLFIREVKAISRLNHPHILPLSDYGTATLYGIMRAYLVMPHSKEGSLAEWMKQPSNAALCTPLNVARFVQQAAAALQEAHDHNIFHKDTKPHNFLLRKNIASPELPDLLLADFGVAKLNTAEYTLGNLPSGTPHYMPPEQWDRNPVAATDQYALAIMTYELLTGQRPFQGNLEKLEEHHKKTPPQLPSTLVSDLPKAIDAVILRALAKKPGDRYTSIKEFAEEFTRAARSEEKGENIHMTLVISETEARFGTEYALPLAGKRSLKVTVPKDTQNGQVIALEGKGKAAPYGGPAGNLLVTIATKPDLPGEQLIAKRFHEFSQHLDQLETKVIANDQNIIEQLQGLWTYLSELQSNYASADRMILVIFIIEIIIVFVIIFFDLFLYFGLTGLPK